MGFFIRFLFGYIFFFFNFRTSLNNMVNERWEQVDDHMRAQMAPLGCSAAWALNSWDRVKHYVSALSADNSFDGAYYRAILNIHLEQYVVACDYITKARDILDADLTAMAGESYDRAYAVGETCLIIIGLLLSFILIGLNDIGKFA